MKHSRQGNGHQRGLKNEFIAWWGRKYNKEKLNYHGKPDQHPVKTISIFLLLRKPFKSKPEEEKYT